MLKLLLVICILTIRSKPKFCISDIKSKVLLERNPTLFPSELESVHQQILHRQRRDSNFNETTEDESNFQDEDIGWSVIDEEVDLVIPRIVNHLRKMGIEHLALTNLNESLFVMPLFIKYEVGLFLTNGLAYNIDGISRFGEAYMTYSPKDKSFICRFNIVIKDLQFDYDFLLRLTPFDGYGKVIGYLDKVIIHIELAIDIIELHLKLNDFHILSFDNIHVELNHRRIVRQLTGAILSPITNLFRNQLTTSISDGLKEQMQLLMDDFNDDDPLQLRKFAFKLLSSLTNAATEAVP